MLNFCHIKYQNNGTRTHSPSTALGLIVQSEYYARHQAVTHRNT